MADGTVGWHRFDAESDQLSEELSSSILPGGGEGRTVILAATPFAQRDGWAAKAVVAIAESWSQENLRIFLMDLGLDTPSLHKALGLLNQEGVSDAFLYGASVQRIAQPALEEAIFFAPAGTATTDPEQILGHPRWNDLAGGFSEADATLLLYLPTNIPGAEKILAWATDIVFLCGEGEEAEEHLGPAAVKVVGNLGPDGTAGPDSEAGGEKVQWSGEPSLVGTVEEGGEGEAPGLDESDLDLAQGLSIAAGFSEAAGDVEAEAEEFGSRDDFVFEEEGQGLLAPEEGGVEAGGTELDVPDFDADFVDMPALEHEVEDMASSGEPSEAGSQPPADEIITGSDIALETGFTSAPGDSAPVPDEGEEAEEGKPAVEGLEKPPAPREKPQFRRDRPRPLSDRRRAPRGLFTKKRITAGAVLLGVLAVLFGTARGLLDVPGLMWLQDIFYDIPAPAMEVEGRNPVGPVLRYSLQLKTYDEDDLALAVEMRDALRSRDPQLLFNLSPMLVDEEVTYVLFAGPAADAVEAVNLRAPLEGIFEREDPESWRPVLTSRAFFLGRTETLEEARDLLSSAEARGALGYVLRVSYGDGTEGFEVLSGSFETAEEARWWQEDLHEKGFQDLPLVDRRGSPPE